MLHKQVTTQYYTNLLRLVRPEPVRCARPSHSISLSEHTLSHTHSLSLRTHTLSHTLSLEPHLPTGSLPVLIDHRMHPHSGRQRDCLNNLCLPLRHRVIWNTIRQSRPDAGLGFFISNVKVTHPFKGVPFSLGSGLPTKFTAQMRCKLNLLSTVTPNRFGVTANRFGVTAVLFCFETLHFRLLSPWGALRPTG
jgi:hypothetical protein